ncbi:MAG: U32 family peptidase [Syntrophobacteraceae bacterium]
MSDIRQCLKPGNSLPELLAPGGNLEKCRTAFLYGADAVYASGKDFGLRGFAHNLDNEGLAHATCIAHRLGKKIYITVNVFAREPDLKRMPPYLEYLRELGIDALIISDPGVLRLARKYAPGIPVHLSTQANTTNSSSIEFWQEQGVSRINLARELSIREIAGIAERSALEIEVFVHGAMCMSYSGRCLMSAFLNNRSANSGYCTQPCRWSWNLVEEKRPGQFFPVQEDSRGTYIFNSKDLCLLEDIGKLASMGIASFKIEGRMKGVLYLASVTRAYRRAIDACIEGRKEPADQAGWMEDLHKVSHRPYTKGLLFGDSGANGSDVETKISYIQTHTLAGIVRSNPDCEALPGSGPNREGERIFMQARSRLVPGQEIEFLYPDGFSRAHILRSFEDLNGVSLPEAHPNKWITFSVDFPVFPFQVVRVEKK